MTLWRHTRPAAMGYVIRPTCLSKTNHWPWNGYSRHIKVVLHGMGSYSSLNHTHRSLTFILTELWLDVLVKMQIFRMVNYLLLLTTQLITAGDLNVWFDLRKLDHRTGNWLFSVTEQYVIVCFVRINAFLPKIDVNDDKQYGCFESFPFRQHVVIFVRQITWLNHLRLLIVLSTKVINLPFWKLAFSQERRATVPSKWPWASGGYGSGWNDSPCPVRPPHSSRPRVTS
jgi:hypothetical protein